MRPNGGNLTAGIVQRAQLLELVLRDLYGEGKLITEGAIPAAAIAGSPNFCARCAGSSRRAGDISASMRPMSAADRTAAGGY